MSTCPEQPAVAPLSAVAGVAPELLSATCELAQNRKLTGMLDRAIQRQRKKAAPPDEPVTAALPAVSVPLDSSGCSMRLSGKGAP